MSLVFNTLSRLLGKSHGRRSLMGCSPWDHKESDMTEWLHFHFSLSCIGEGNGAPLQCSCLENPRDGGAWRAAVYGVTQSRTRLKRLSSSSRFVIAILPISKHLLISWLQSLVPIDFGAQENEIWHFSTFSPSACHEVIGLMPWSWFFECWVLSQLFHSPLFTFIKRLFSSSSLSAIRMVSSAYLRFLIFLPAILIPACGSSSQHFSWWSLHIS